MSEKNSERDPYAMAAGRLRALQPDGDAVLLHHAQFAGYLGDWLERKEAPETELMAQAFINASALALSELQTGRNHRSEPITGHPLLHMGEATMRDLFSRTPFFARVGFSDEFGDQVGQVMVEQNLLPRPAAADTEISPADPGELITEPVTDAETAYAKIVEDARTRVLGMGLEAYGLSAEPMRDKDEHMLWAHIILERAAIIPAIAILADVPGPEHEALQRLLPERKKDLGNGRWLVMSVYPIPPDYATVTRDILVLKTVDGLAGMERDDSLSEAALYERLLERNRPFLRAVARMQEFIDRYPHLNTQPL